MCSLWDPSTVVLSCALPGYAVWAGDQAGAGHMIKPSGEGYGEVGEGWIQGEEKGWGQGFFLWKENIFAQFLKRT